MIKGIRLFFKEKRIKKTIKEATELTMCDGRKRIILNVSGQPRVYTKKKLQQLIRQRYFRRGVTIQDLETTALFITK